MTRRSIYALEFRELNAIRRQSEKDNSVLGFKVSGHGLIPIEADDPSCDLAVGRNALYLYAPDADDDPLPRQPLTTGGAVDSVFRLLAPLPEFESLSDAQLMELSQKATRRAIPAGDVIVRQGDVGDSLFVVAEGVVRVYTAGADGADDPRARLVTGACFGEMSLLTGEPRSATVEAETPTVVYEIEKSHLRPFLESDDAIITALSRLMAERQIAYAHRQYFEALNKADPHELSQTFSGKVRHFFGLA